MGGSLTKLVTLLVASRKLINTGLVSSRMGDHQQVCKPATQVNSAGPSLRGQAQ